MAYDYKSMGQRIARRRKELGLTQKELAAMVNISGNHLSNIENGKSTPGFDTFLEICKALQTDFYYIIGDGVYSTIDVAIVNKLNRKSPENRIIISKIIDDFPDQTIT